MPYHYPLAATTSYYTRDPQQAEELDNVRAKRSEEELAKLHQDFPAVFGEATGEVASRPPLPVKCHITLDDKPFFLPPPYPVPLKYRERIVPQLQELVDSGVVRFTSGTRYLSPLLVVPKHDGGLRPCSDFRILNSHTVSEPYPLPRIDELKLTIQGSVFTTLDLSNAFYNIAIADEDVYKTATATPIGVIEFTRMCFGLKNAPAIFQRCIDDVLRGLPHCVAYIDDILIYSHSMARHVQHVREVFKRLDKWGLRIKLKKCHFFQHTVNFLGIEFSPCGYRLNPTFPKFLLCSHLSRRKACSNFWA